MDQEELTEKLLYQLKDVSVDLSKFYNLENQLKEENGTDDDIEYDVDDNDNEGNIDPYYDDDLEGFTSYSQLHRSPGPVVPLNLLISPFNEEKDEEKNEILVDVGKDKDYLPNNCNYNTCVTLIPNIESDVLKYIQKIGIKKLGLLSIFPLEKELFESKDSSIEYEFIKDAQSIGRRWIREKIDFSFDLTLFLKPKFQKQMFTSSLPLSVLDGFDIEDIEYLKAKNINTVGHLADLSQYCENEESETCFSSRILFYSFIANRLLEYSKSLVKQLDNLFKEKELYVYHYTTNDIFSLIDSQSKMKSVKALFEDYINTDVSTRFNHPWRKVYFSYLAEATKHYKLTSGQLSDLDLYTFLVWRSSNSSGLSATNCSNGVRAIYFYWKPIESKDCLGAYHKDFESIVKINLTKCIENNLPIYFCGYDTDRHSVENNNNNININGPTSRLNKENWYLASKNDIEIEYQKDYWKQYSNFNRGMDPKVLVPHGCIITLDGALPLNFYST
ncbi:hypothetical protein CYY_006873 [Polysphondylium violaceum]|uniref:Uncharacterized protein n=1 Tax=Polysphondylium violaceum TaxID=133409 RepID=A0A8J4PR93_9MYCE|nr:hypothetical protein CYY_006873 [Polysphondylium violaceum]